MRKILKRQKNMTGYLSLEASFVVPLVFMLFILGIYFTFFLYNHLVVEQSCYIAALRGSRLKNTADSVVEKYTGDELGKLLDEQIYQYQNNGNVKVTGFKVETNASSYITNRLKKLGIYNEEQLITERKAGVIRLDPAAVLRVLHRPGKRGNDGNN